MNKRSSDSITQRLAAIDAERKKLLKDQAALARAALRQAEAAIQADARHRGLVLDRQRLEAWKDETVKAEALGRLNEELTDPDERKAFGLEPLEAGATKPAVSGLPARASRSSSDDRPEETPTTESERTTTASEEAGA